jgi:hypothetical protein
MAVSEDPVKPRVKPKPVKRSVQKRSPTNHGRFVPKHPEKYMGDAGNIFFRSSWEYHLLKWLDATPAVVRYASEEIAIPYLHPFDKKVRRYFPDFLVVYKDKNGNLQTELIEVKPYRECVVTPKTKDPEKMVIAVNHAKWEAAEKFCQLNGLKFRVLHEKNMFLNGRKK